MFHYVSTIHLFFRTISFCQRDVISIFCSLLESVWMLFIRDALLVGLVTLGATYAVYRTGKYIYVKQRVRIFLLEVKKCFVINL